VGPRAGLDTEIRGKIHCPCRALNPGRPVRNQSGYTGTFEVGHAVLQSRVLMHNHTTKGTVSVYFDAMRTAGGQ
jgi:hypothetical protein